MTKGMAAKIEKMIGIHVYAPDTASMFKHCDEIDAGHKADVVVELDGVKKEFTLAEFKKRLGCE